MEDDLNWSIAMTIELAVITSGLAIEMAARGLLHAKTAENLAARLEWMAEQLERSDQEQHSQMLRLSVAALRSTPQEHRPEETTEH